MIQKLVFHRDNFETIHCTELRKLLADCFHSECPDISRSDEELCRIIYESDGRYVAHGAGYVRHMSVGEYRFKAGIIGGICVGSEFRGQGLAHAIVRELNAAFTEQGAAHAFLFANESAVYTGCGYKLLENTMHIYDTVTARWQTWFWNNSMYINLGDAELPQGILEFNGCNY